MVCSRGEMRGGEGDDAEGGIWVDVTCRWFSEARRGEESGLVWCGRKRMLVG